MRKFSLPLYSRSEVELGHQSVPHMELSVRSISERSERGGGKEKKNCSCSIMVAKTRYDMLNLLLLCSRRNIRCQTVCPPASLMINIEKQIESESGSCLCVFKVEICSKKVASIVLHRSVNNNIQSPCYGGASSLDYLC